MKSKAMATAMPKRNMPSFKNFARWLLPAINEEFTLSNRRYRVSYVNLGKVRFSARFIGMDERRETVRPPADQRNVMMRLIRPNKKARKELEDSGIQNRPEASRVQEVKEAMVGQDWVIPPLNSVFELKGRRYKVTHSNEKKLRFSAKFMSVRRDTIDADQKKRGNWWKCVLDRAKAAFKLKW